MKVQISDCIIICIVARVLLSYNRVFRSYLPIVLRTELLIMATNTKQAILQASIKAFSERGYYGVSVRQIAAEVGIKEGSIYNHYASKEDIFNHVLEKCCNYRKTLYITKEEIEEITRTKPTETVLKRLVFQIPESGKNNLSNFVKILFRDQYTNPKVAEEYRIFFTEVEEKIRLTLKRLIEYKKISSCNLDILPKVLAELLFSSLNNITYGKFFENNINRDLSKVKTPVDFILYQISQSK